MDKSFNFYETAPKRQISKRKSIQIIAGLIVVFTLGFVTCKAEPVNKHPETTETPETPKNPEVPETPKTPETQNPSETPKPPEMAAQPIISKNLTNIMVFKGGTIPPLTVTASSSDGGTLSYQWYSNKTLSNGGGTLITNAAEASYTPSISAATAGNYYYYAVITNTNPDALVTKTSTAITEVAHIKVSVIPPPNATVTVNTNTKYQYVRGFGGIDSPWPGGNKALTLDNIETMYNPDKLGYNIMRIMVMPDNTNPDNTIANLIKAGGSRPYYIEGVKLVNKYGGYVLATPWSPPATWKNNNAINCEFAGTHDCENNIRSVKLLPANYQNYANYLKAFCNAMSNRGAPIYAISIQNEPNGHVGYDGCIWTPEEMRDFFKQVGNFTTGTTGWGGGKAQSKVLAMNGETMHTVEINDAAINDPGSRANIDILGRHLYGYKMQGKMANLYGKEIWMSEYNINENSNKRDEKNDYTWNYVWLFMNAVDLSIRLNEENAFIWWTSKRWYSLIGEGDYGTTANTVLPRGYGLSHYAKFAKETNRVGISVSGKTGDGGPITTTGTTANFNHGTYSDGPNDGNSKPTYLNDYQRAVKVNAFASPDGNSISLVMFTPTWVDGTKGIDMGTVKIQLPSGFKIANAKAMRSTASVKSQTEDVVIGVDENTAYVTLPASTILSVMLKK
jgi:O-glycosyl hydrolase